jgi:hypothetical protein
MCSDNDGLWIESEEAIHVGRESDRPDAPDWHVFRVGTQIIALWNPFDRGIVEKVELGAPPTL